MNVWNLFRPAVSDARPFVEQIVQKAAQALAPYGYRRNGSNFQLQTNECWAIINFQKSQGNTRQDQRFTVNLGVASKRVLAFDRWANSHPPKEYECCWRTRLGCLPPPGSDLWWTVNNASDAQRAGRDIEDRLLRHGVPTVASLLTDQALLGVTPEEWHRAAIVSGHYYRVRAIIAAGLGRRETAEQALDAWRLSAKGTPSENSCEEAIRRVLDLMQAS